MRYTIIGAGMVVGIAVVAGFLWWIRPAPSTPPDNSGSIPYPGNSTITVSPTSTSTSTSGANNQTGTQATVKDFLSDPRTVVDPQNPGRYHLAGGSGLQQVNAQFLIVYVERDQSFTVSLEQEPLSKTRIDAEAYLMDMLGISRSQMCALRYMVLVPNDVNEIYSGKNLGFSFCPGATIIP